MRILILVLFTSVALLFLACTSEPTHTPLPSPTPEPTVTSTVEPATLLTPTPEPTVRAEVAATLSPDPADNPWPIPPSTWVTWEEVRETQVADGLPWGRPRVVTYGIGPKSPSVGYGLRIECVEEHKALLVNMIEKWPDGTTFPESQEEVPVYHEFDTENGEVHDWLLAMEGSRPAVWWLAPRELSEDLVDTLLSDSPDVLLLWITRTTRNTLFRWRST